MSAITPSVSVVAGETGTIVTATGTQTVGASAPTCTSSSSLSFGGGKAAGCWFSNTGLEAENYRSCCRNSPLVALGDGCTLFCAATGPQVDELKQCLSGLSTTFAVGCQDIQPGTSSSTTSATPTITTPSTSPTSAAGVLRAPITKGYFSGGMLVAGLLTMSLFTGLLS